MKVDSRLDNDSIVQQSYRRYLTPPPRGRRALSGGFSDTFCLGMLGRGTAQLVPRTDEAGEAHLMEFSTIGVKKDGDTASQQLWDGEKDGQ